MEKTQNTTQESEQAREIKERNKHVTYASKCVKDVLNLSLLSEVSKTNTKLD